MSGKDKDMTDMTPIRKRGLLERADQRFGLGGALKGDAAASAAAPAVAPEPAQPDGEPRVGARIGLRPTPLEAIPARRAPNAPPVVLTPTEATPATLTPTSPAVPERRWPGNRAPAVPMPLQAVDRALMAEHALIDPDGMTDALAEEFRIIKRQLLRNAETIPNGRRVLVTSSQPDEGKTFTSCNLALSLAAERDLSVLLIDGDSARGDVPQRLGLTPGAGLMDVLADPKMDVRRCVIPTDIRNLSVLPAGQSSTRDTEFLSSARMAEVLATLEEDAPGRVILFDSTPLLAASSAGVLAALCGQVVVVVRAEVTREAALRDAISLIGHHSGISLLLNRVRFTPEGRRFGSYYGEGG